MSRSLSALVAVFAVCPLAAQEPGRVLDLSEAETPPLVQNAGDFQAALAAGYPPELRAEGVEGTVLVAFVVDVDGSVREPAVVEASHEGLSAATLEAVRVLRFAPATVGGRPVAVRATLPVQWRAAPPPEPETETPPTSAPAESREETVRWLIGDDPALAAMAAGARELNEVEEQPRPLNAGALQQALQREFPPELRLRGISATVLVRFLVGADGAVHLPYTTASTHPGFVEPTTRVIRLLRFRPARVGRRPVAAWVELPIQWVVTDGADPDPRLRDRGYPSRELPLPPGEPPPPRDLPRPPQIHILL